MCGGCVRRWDGDVHGWGGAIAVTETQVLCDGGRAHEVFRADVCERTGQAGAVTRHHCLPISQIEDPRQCIGIPCGLCHSDSPSRSPSASANTLPPVDQLISMARPLGEEPLHRSVEARSVSFEEQLCPTAGTNPPPVADQRRSTS